MIVATLIRIQEVTNAEIVLIVRGEWNNEETIF